MADGGWIKLHRKITEHWIWQDPEKLRAWIDLLLMVNHEDKSIPYNGKIITIRRGQKLTSIYKLADRWGWSRLRVHRYLELLKADGMCHTDVTTSGTIITIDNWDLYQIVRTTNDTASVTTNDTTTVTTSVTQTRMIKNDKEGKKGASPQPQSDEPDPHATDDEGIRRYLEAEEAKGRWS